MEFSRQDTGVGSHPLHQGIFPTQGSDTGLLHCRQILSLSEQPGKPLLKYIINSTYQLIVLISSLIFVSYVHFFLLYELCSGVSIRRGFPGGSVKNLPAKWETWVQSLVWEDPLEEGMATHSSILAWRIPWTEGPGGLQSTGSQRIPRTEGPGGLRSTGSRE